MDFAKAALLIAAVFGMTELVKSLLPDSWKENRRIVVAVAIVVGQAATWLLSTTAWAHEQVIGSKPMDELNTGSLILVGVFVAATAAFSERFLDAARNLGQNQPTLTQRKALDAAAERYAAGQGDPDAGGSHPNPDVPLVFPDDTP